MQKLREKDCARIALQICERNKGFSQRSVHVAVRRGYIHAMRLPQYTTAAALMENGIRYHYEQYRGGWHDRDPQPLFLFKTEEDAIMAKLLS